MTNVFYFKHINIIGGVESWFYYLSCKYKNMVVFYREGDPKQIERLARNVEVIKYTGQKIKCKRFFCSYSPDIIEEVEAEEYIHIIHCDYKGVSFSPIRHPKFTKYIGVSKLVCDSFEELTGIKAECIYNPVSIEKPNVEKYNDGKLHLISATRLTREKGLKRMQKLAKMLEDANIDYEWLIYSNRHREYVGKNAIYKEPKLDIIEDIAKADILVQLSDHEAFCYSVIEAACVGTTPLITDLPVYKELGLNDSNSIKYSDNMDIKSVLKCPKVSYTPPKDNWSKYLSGKRDYNPNELIEVKAKVSYTDVFIGKKLKRGDKAKMPKWRVSMLEAMFVRTGMTGLVERI